jgi:UDP-N-acetylglucosamine:LPS N-acetylglucosamine transferase
MKVCIVSSCGGHLTEVRRLFPAYGAYEHFYVVNDRIDPPADMSGKMYIIVHAERNWKVLVNLWEAFGILRRERPDVILSAGAGPVVPFAVVGKLFFGAYVVFLETATRVHAPSLTGQIMYRIADEFYYQWQSLARFFPKGNYGGCLL